MKKYLGIISVVTASVLALAGCAPAAQQEPTGAAHAAVVIVSGGAAVSPFTTPDQACATGLAAGNTDTALRADLLTAGYEVYTSPAEAGRGTVTDQTGFGPFSDCPVTLPENMTVNSTGSIDTAGEHLARFLTYLQKKHGVTEVNLVGHSMGGLYSRAAMRVLQGLNSTLTISSLTTIGTPWQGAFLSDYANGDVTLEDCLGDTFCETSMGAFRDEVLNLVSGSGREVSSAYLMGNGKNQGWNEFQSGVLDNIPVVLIGGDIFTAEGGKSRMWPNDGIVALQSALATDVTDDVLPHRSCLTFDDTHSIFVSHFAGLAENTGLTWDPRVLKAVQESLKNASGALAQPNRVGCPQPTQ